MANRKAQITQAEITRALKATREAGFSVARIEFTPKAGMKIFIGDQDTLEPQNEWDAALGLE
ncbi:MULTISPECIES: hypothetical protein [Roseobacteraceae]|uniref:hypothetical protein n=1 Tax=Roseobacteraceae TaxID=2854170 RepID=UPI00147D7246|nr:MULTISPECIES: hypothetical protein [Roseobacteraceae]MDA5557691.1 hypothetical protein [Shimia sp. MMG029]UWR92921.1 hypothetical protein K4K96_02385 [Phaeobacter inhibens]